MKTSWDKTPNKQASLRMTRLMISATQPILTQNVLDSRFSPKRRRCFKNIEQNNGWSDLHISGSKKRTLRIQKLIRSPRLVRDSRGENTCSKTNAFYVITSAAVTATCPGKLSLAAVMQPRLRELRWQTVRVNSLVFLHADTTVHRSSTLQKRRTSLFCF